MRLAVLIDAENASPATAEPLMAEVAKYGVAHVKRAYGDWTGPMLNGWKQHLLTLSIQPVQQFGWTTGRNASDAALIIDAMDLLYSGRFDGFCLVSSDSDFTRLAARLRESGLMVFGIGERKTHSAFVAACDKFVYVENLTAAQQPGAIASKGRRAGASPPGPELTELVTAAVEAFSDEDGWAHLGAVGLYLSKSKPDFDTRTYGYTKLKPLVRALNAFEIDHRSPGPGKPVVAYVRCRERPAAGAPDASDGEQQEPVQHGVVQAVRLPIPSDRRSRELLLQRIHTAWRAEEIDTIGRLEALMEQHAPDMDKPTRNIAISSLIHQDTAVLHVRDPSTTARAERRIEPFDGQPEQQWVDRGHVAWLAYVIYRLAPGQDSLEHLTASLFDDVEQGRTMLTAAHTIARARKSEAVSPTRPSGSDAMPVGDTEPGGTP